MLTQDRQKLGRTQIICYLTINLRGDAGNNDPIFPSREGEPESDHLYRSQLNRIVAAAGKRAGIKDKSYYLAVNSSLAMFEASTFLI